MINTQLRDKRNTRPSRKMRELIAVADSRAQVIGCVTTARYALTLASCVSKKRSHSAEAGVPTTNLTGIKKARETKS